MRLLEFIRANHEVIINEWVAFARTLLPWAETMSEKGLKDHAEEILSAITEDMNSPQGDDEKAEKSKGNGVEGELAKVGEKHAIDRLESGLEINKLVAEYRALRASVLRLWEESQGDKQNEVTRFNEAIDETLSRATIRYSEKVNDTREQFLAILGHDLRNPIGAVIMGATLLTDSDDESTAKMATNILVSGERMNRMVLDLLDLTRTRLGGGIPIKPKPMDLASMCRQVISEHQTIYPERLLRFESTGDVQGNWDSDRLAQVTSNLIANALQYGSSDGPVSVVAQESSEEVTLQVHNEGPPIPENAMKTIFAPMTRYQREEQRGDNNATGLGLGLYIASEIVTAHDGTISVTSSEQKGTTFTLKIPRYPIPDTRYPISKSAPTAIPASYVAIITLISVKRQVAFGLF